MIRDYKNINSDKKYRYFLENTDKFPFCFKYGDKEYEGFGELELVRKQTEREGSVETNTLVYALDVLNITLKFTHYFSHGVSEWTVWFENLSDKDSGEKLFVSDRKTTLNFETPRCAKLYFVEVI